jgi:hypothetical protein
MKTNKNLFKLIFTIFFVVLTVYSHAQTQHRWEDIDTSGFHKKEIIKKDGLTLIVINKDSLFNATTLQNMVAVFWKIYPQEMNRFNPQSLRTVTILISNDYKGVAATQNGIIKIDQNWLTVHPEDIDVITHEAMHIVQAYPYQPANLWLSEGIADYARYTFGVNNLKSGWALPSYHDGQNYTNSYRISARFLVWMEKYKRKDIVNKLDTALRNGSYQTFTWVKLTGKTIDELWAEYTSNPII